MPGELTRFCSQLFWNETALDLNGNSWAQQNSNDQVLAEMRSAGANTSTPRTSGAGGGTSVPARP